MQNYYSTNNDVSMAILPFTNIKKDNDVLPWKDFNKNMAVV